MLLLPLVGGLLKQSLGFSRVPSPIPLAPPCLGSKHLNVFSALEQELGSRLHLHGKTEEDCIGGIREADATVTFLDTWFTFVEAHSKFSRPSFHGLGIETRIVACNVGPVGCLIRGSVVMSAAGAASLKPLTISPKVVVLNLGHAGWG